MKLFKESFFLAGSNRGRLKLVFTLMALRGILKIAPLLILYFIVLEILSFDINLAKLLGLAACLGFVFLIINVWDHYLALSAMKLGHKLSYDIRMSLGDKLRKLSLGFFIKKPTGELNTIMSEYVSRFENFISYMEPFFFSSIVSTFTIMIFFLFLDWRMALGAASVVPLALVAFRYADKIAQRVTKAREESLRRTNSVIIEFIQGIPVIKIFNQVASRFSRFKETIEDFRDKNIQTVVSTTIPSIILLTFTSLSIVVLLPLGLYFYFKGSLSLSILVFFIIAAPSFSDSLAHYLFGYMHIKSSTSQAIEHISKTLKEKPLTEPKDDVELKKFDIEFRDVFFSYDKEPVLKGMSFKVPEKSITALVGPSGSGKTTITNLIARFWDTGSGEVRIGGLDIRKIKLDKLLSYISMVFQEVILFNDTIAQNIRLGRKDATDKEIIMAAKAARCHDFISNLSNGYNTNIGERGVKLSEGEKQRISIARAILKNAPILILDEATVHIDPENEKLIQNAVSELVKNKTVLVIAHRLSTITSTDQILVLGDGRIAEKGTHRELLEAKGLYARLWERYESSHGWKF